MQSLNEREEHMLTKLATGWRESINLNAYMSARYDEESQELIDFFLKKVTDALPTLQGNNEATRHNQKCFMVEVNLAYQKYEECMLKGNELQANLHAILPMSSALWYEY